MSKSDLVDVDVVLMAETRDAIKVSTMDDVDGHAIWLPKSQIEYALQKGTRRTYTVTLPEWLAESKELI